MRTVTEKIYVITATWVDDKRPPTTYRTNDLEETEKLAGDLLCAGAISVHVEPMRVRVSDP